DVHKPGRVKRFIREAQLCGQLEHEFIVPIHDMGLLADGRPYYTMKLVEGEDLKARLSRRGKAGEGRTELLQIFGRVCQAMAFAHQKGVIHRDLTPENIRLSKYGELQLMDWGVAKALQDTRSEPAELVPMPGATSVADASAETATIEPADAPTSSDEAGECDNGSQDSSTTLTGQTTVFGKYPYIPPEQARGQIDNVDRRSDVFALGAILCEMLTGQPPYIGSKESIRQQAQQGSLEGARARLRACVADKELACAGELV